MELQSKNTTFGNIFLSVLTLILATSGCAIAEPKMQHKQDHISHENETAHKSLHDELVELRATVTKLEAALEKKHNASNKNMQGHMMRMASMNKHGMHKGGMKMKGMKNMQDSKGTNGKKMKMMGMGMMSMMGKMHGKAKMGMQMGDKTNAAELPSFPGASHLYHIGSTDFYLDHTDHIQLSQSQKEKISEIKGASLKNSSQIQESIDSTEKEIWNLTGSDKPDISQISKKIREVGELMSKQRIDFIHSVGEAARILDNTQRVALVNQALAQTKADGDHIH